jgi:sporulation protein YlmC with PRC-barrel domain
MKSWLKDIKGMWVATYTEGAMLGTVNNIYLDPEEKKVVGLVLRTGTPLAGEDLWIDIKNVKKIGVDLIFLSKGNTVAKDEPQGKKLAQLIGMPISSKDGRALGQLVDVEVDRDSWQITELGLNNNQSVPVDRMETVLGEDLILVQAKVEPETRSSQKNKENLVDQVFGKDFIKQTSDAVKRVLRGSEAELPKPKPEEKPSEEEPSSGEEK